MQSKGATPGAPPGATAFPTLPGTPPAVPEKSLQEWLELAKQVRGLQDMQGALEILKRVDLQHPNQPAVLAEMAQCYEQMGLADKAAALWRQLEGMNPAQAAGYQSLAARRLQAAVSSTGTSAVAAPGEGPKVLTLGACQAVRDNAVVNGEKVVLTIPLLREGNAAIDPSQVDIDVYFFDRVNGEKVAQTIADDPVTTWAATPVDWAGAGEEPLKVTYFLPPLTPGEVQAHGRRSYHGYVVRLYYQHKLQDTAAEPRDLLDFGSGAPQMGVGTGNPLLPPVAQ